MKTFKYFLFTFIFASTLNIISGQTLNFSYDTGGNLTERKLVVSPGARLASKSTLPDSVWVIMDNLKVYPNPSNTYINIEGPLPENIQQAKLFLLTSSGQHIREDVYNGSLKTMNVSDLKSGMYLLEMQIGKKEKKTFKLIVSN